MAGSRHAKVGVMNADIATEIYQRLAIDKGFSYCKTVKLHVLALYLMIFGGRQITHHLRWCSK